MVRITEVVVVRVILSIALRIRTAHDFRVITARSNEHVHVHNERNFPQAKLDPCIQEKSESSKKKKRKLF